eukprot:5793405-Lingulodinium_polyedra.AAC.1
MSRVRSARQRRDRASAEFAAAEAERKLVAARAEVSKAAEQLELAEAELRQAGDVVAGEAAPPPIAA